MFMAIEIPKLQTGDYQSNHFIIQIIYHTFIPVVYKWRQQYLNLLIMEIQAQTLQKQNKCNANIQRLEQMCSTFHFGHNLQQLLRKYITIL